MGTPVELKIVYRSLLYIIEKDEFCFLYSVLAGLVPQKKHIERPLVYLQYTDQRVYKLSDFPMNLSKIPGSKRLNNLSVPVYQFEQVKPLNILLQQKSKMPTKSETATDFRQ